MLEKIEKFQIIVACLIITLGIIFVSLLFASKMPKSENITVTGSAYKVVKSDRAKLTLEIKSTAPTQKDAYNKLNAQKPIVLNYLKDKGIEEKNIDIKSVNGYYTYQTNDKGYSTNKVEAYNAQRNIEISSDDVNKIKDISIDIEKLVNKGANISMYPPEYYYSNLSEIKVELLEEAVTDAKNRAKSMLKATGARVGKVKQMRMGVFQITPVDSTSVSDMGINDTTTIDKKVTAVTNVVFKVK